jgi:hypothetical protein
MQKRMRDTGQDFAGHLGQLRVGTQPFYKTQFNGAPCF